MMRPHASILAFLLIAVACGDLSSPTAPTATRCHNPAPLFRYPNAVPSRYIVIYREGVDVRSATATLEAKYDITIIHIYEVSLQGFSAIVSPDTVQSLRCEPSVKEIHEVISAPSPTTNSARQS